MISGEMTLTSQEKSVRSHMQQTKPLAYAKSMRYSDKLARGESVALLDVQYSFLCNFHCTHCALSTIRDIHRPQLTVTDIRALCDQADAIGLAHFCLTGGEPTVFKDLEAIIEAIGPERFYITIDTNGWTMTKKKAEQLAALGVDRIQVSLDGLDAESHDAFRRKPGAYVKALQAMKYIKAAGMGLQIGSVLTHERIATGEMERFLTFTDTLGGKVSLTFPFLLGEWEGRSDLLLTDKDMAIMREMETRHNVATHLSSKYGNPGECMAVKRMVIISPWGDVNPCAGIRRDLGNILDEPLADILQRAMRVYGKPCRVCRVGMLPSMTVEDMA